MAPDGVRFRAHQEIMDDKQAEKRRADAEAQRVERLAARLRELGESLD